MTLLPAHFLFRIAYPCRYVAGLPLEDEDNLLDLSETCRLDNFAPMTERRNFADVRLAWNEFGLAMQVEVKGKEQLPKGDASRPRGSDGVSLWIDTRGARASHRASQHCHQFHFLPMAGGPERDEPIVVQTKIHRALQDAPLCQPNDVPFRCRVGGSGYRLEAFLPAAVLNGFDPEQNPRLGVFYAIRDAELGEQVLSVGADFPYWEDPSLWSALELARPGPS